MSSPVDAATTFETRARFPVQATFNGVPYRGSTMPSGDGRFRLGIAKAIPTRAGADVGATVHVVVGRDPAERVVERVVERAGPGGATSCQAAAFRG